MDIISRQTAIEQHLSHYFTGTPCKYGHVARRSTKDNNCVECARLRSKANREKDPDKARRDCVESELRLKETNPKLWQQKRKQWRRAVRDKHGPVKYMFGQVRGRAKRNGQAFTITRDDIVVPSHCPILGIPLAISTDMRSDNSPSLDRIDNTRGYVPGNVHVISWRANKLKNDGTARELELIAQYLRRLEHESNTHTD